MGILVFASYKSEDKKIAGQIKGNIEKLGLDVFLAHEDIEPSAEWEEVILTKLEETDVFLPLLTENFTKSYYTGQESGFALCRKILIIPIMIDVKPFGFLDRFQGLKANLDDMPSTCLEIVGIIFTRGDFGERLTRCIIDAFKKSFTFKEAELRSKILSVFASLDKEQVDEILLASCENDQIYGSFSARKDINNLVEKYKSIVNRDLVALFHEKVKEYDRARA